MNLKDILFTKKSLNTKQFVVAVISTVVVYFFPFIISGAIVGALNPQNTSEATSSFFDSSLVAGIVSVWVLACFVFLAWIIFKYFKYLFNKTY